MTSTDRNLHDLAWCLSSAPLISPQDECWREPDWFNRVSLPADLPDVVSTSHKLGIHFENIICNWIEATADLELLARNLPVRDSERTLGEFDLIVRHEDQVEHWELAVKFYLGMSDQGQMHDWYGPNPIDTLAAKVNRVTNHQLKLSEQPAAKQLLQEKGWQINQTRAFVKGRLFHPYNAFRHREFNHPKDVNENHEKGWWMTDTGFELQEDLKDGQYAILEKRFWLAPITSDLEFAAMSHEDILRYLKHENRGGTLHVARLDADLNEISRGFIVLRQWVQDASG